MARAGGFSEAFPRKPQACRAWQFPSQPTSPVKFPSCPMGAPVSSHQRELFYGVNWPPQLNTSLIEHSIGPRRCAKQPLALLQTAVS